MELNRLSGNIVLNSLRETEVIERKGDVPAGYITIKLSTKGKVGAPAEFHIRNFKVKDIISLSLTDGNDLPKRLINILNDMILENKDEIVYNVANWHEKEIEETMVYVFMNFYKNEIEIPFPWDEKDIEYLKNQPGSEGQIEALNNKKWTPLTTINIGRDADIYEQDEKFKSVITITDKQTGFFCTFDYIKYGDQLIVKKWLDSFYAKEEKEFSRIKEQIEFNNNLISRLSEDKSVLSKFIPLDKDEEERYNEYITKRLQTLSEVVKLISVVNYNGLDISGMSLAEKYELMSEDARIDYGMIEKLSKRQEKMKFGLKPEINMLDPITREVVKRPFSFQLSTLLQAMQLSGDNRYDDGFDDED